MIILDTDIVTIIQRASGEPYRCLASRLDEVLQPVFVTIITFEEQTRGWLAYIARSRSLQRQVQAYAKLRASRGLPDLAPHRFR